MVSSEAAIAMSEYHINRASVASVQLLFIFKLLERHRTRVNDRVNPLNSSYTKTTSRAGSGTDLRHIRQNVPHRHRLQRSLRA
jgi:hypothetical protein